MNRTKFIEEIKKLGIEITDEQLNQLDLYFHLLVETNKKFNLTAITEEQDVYLKHFYDSLTIVKAIKLDNQSLCDVGTGAGFPGLVLKIVFPNLNVTLIDATNKKCLFLQEVITQLNLKKIQVINARIEEYSKVNREKFDIVTCRAVAPLKHLLEYSIPLVKVNGLFIPLKGNLNNELENIDNYIKKLNITQEQDIVFNLPVENSHRHILVFRKNNITNSLYPRRYSDIKKKEI